MIYLKDNFLPDIILNSIEKYLVDFKEVDTGEKKFWVMDTPIEFQKWIINKISIIENKQIKDVFSFFRISTDKLDTDWRIHCDSIIQEFIPERALVLYLSKSPYKELRGTAFWEHHKYGEYLPTKYLNTDIYNDLIKNDANDLNKWKLKSVVGLNKNRLVSWPANYFHSKYPNKSWEKGRKIFVMFYK